MRAAADYQRDVERRGQETAYQYVKHPASWLNAECWSDEPAKPAGSTIDSDGNPVAAAPPPNRPPPQWGRESNTERFMRKLQQQGGV